METNIRLQFFVNELNDINDQKLKTFAIKLLTEAPDYFFTVPASSSGKYHPYFAREENDLVKHTRCVVFFADPSHQLIMSKCDGEVFVTVHLKPLMWYERIINAVKYILGFRSIYGEFIFNERDSEKLQEIVDYLKYEKDRSN